MEAKDIGWQASGRGGAVAAGARPSVAAGMTILEDGGNAADAAVATILALAVVDYGLFAMGGEVPLIIWHEGEVQVLSGVGRAPLDADAIAWYYDNGIPDEGSYLAMPVPGALHLCFTALSIFGTKSFGEVVTPTLDLLDRGGKSWHDPLAATLRKLAEREEQTRGSRERKLEAARDRFYRGDIADDLVAWYEETGSFLRKRDLEAHETVVEPPVSIRYRDYTVHKCNTWTQGPVLCQTLRLLEGFDIAQMQHLSADHIHLLTEAMKLAYADRDTYYADPEFADVPLAALLSDEYTDLRRGLIDMGRASHERRPGDPIGMRPLLMTADPGAHDVSTPISDTTTCAVTDRWGNMVAATPSCNLVGNEPDPRTGITQGNRLRCMNTTPTHPNRIEAGKRPRITLTPTLVTCDDRPMIAISVAGGDLQDQTTLNVLINSVEFGMDPAEAVTVPRFSTDHMENSFDSDPDRDAAFKAPGSLQVNDDVSTDVLDELSARGHNLSTTDGYIAMPVMLSVDLETGLIRAAGDPKAGRHAAALEQ